MQKTTIIVGYWEAEYGINPGAFDLEFLVQAVYRCKTWA